MLDDFTPIFHDIPGRTIKVWPIADVHIGARESNVAGFEKFLTEKVLPDPDSFVVLCGDIVSNGLKDSLTNVYDEILSPSQQVDCAAELLQPVADRILGCVSGNHEARSRKTADIDPLWQIMTLIGKPELFRQNLCFVRVKMTDGSAREYYNMLLVHGKTAFKKKQFHGAIEGVDVVVSGHTHEGLIEKPSRLVFTQKGLIKTKNIVSVTATSWLDYGGYAAASLLLPKATSDPQCLVLEFTRGNRQEGKIRVAW